MMLSVVTNVPWSSGDLASERSTRASPATHVPAPANCQNEYLVPSAYQVSAMAHTTVQQSNRVTLVMYEYWYAFTTATYCLFNTRLAQ
jgi:hypothetical protein